MDPLPSLDSTFGVLFIAVVLSAALCGVSYAQAFYYFQHYSQKDDIGTKGIVVATLITDTVHQALISHAVYTYVITYYFQPQKLEILVWSVAVATAFNGITTLLVQTFYAVRIWRFNQKNVIVTGIVAIFIVAGFVSVMIYVARSVYMSTLEDLTKLKALSMTVNVLTAAGDVLITIVFCVLLYRTQTNLQRSNTMINLLIALSVQTGMLTSLFAVAALISILLAPNTFIYMVFYYLLGRLYCNSLLATLNVRKGILERGQDDLGISLSPMDDSIPSTVDSSKVDGKSISMLESQVSKPADISQVSKHKAVMVARHSFNPHLTTTLGELGVSMNSSRDDRDATSETSVVLNAPSSAL